MSRLHACLVQSFHINIHIIHSHRESRRCTAMDADRRRGLSQLAVRSYVSQRGLASVLKDVKDNPNLLEACSRSSIKRARNAAVMIRTTYGDLIQYMDIGRENGEGHITVAYIHPTAMLSNATEQFLGYSSYFQGKLASSPNSATRKWTVCFYNDEVAIGNQLAHNTKRNLQTIYWSFKEFGEDLSNDTLWFTLTAIRSKLVEQIGGMSVLLNHIMMPFLQGHDMSTGITLRLGGRPVMFFADINLFIADESAIKHSCENKGASGLLICICCSNVVDHKLKAKSNHVRTLVDADASGELVPTTDTDYTKFRLHTNESVHALLQKLREQQLTSSKAHFEEMQTRLGWNLCERGLLMNARIGNRIINMIMFDWMHVYIVNGIFNVEVGLLLGQLRRRNIRFGDLQNFVQKFSWPARLQGNSASGVFEKRTGKLADPLKCSASECLSVYGMIRMFIAMYVWDAHATLQPALTSYYRLCSVLDLLMTAQSGKLDSNVLHRAIVNHLDSHKLAYGTGGWIVKFHMSMHLGAMLSSHGLLLNCFVLERKHRDLKTAEKNFKDTSKNYELGMLQESLRVQLHDLASPGTLPNTGLHLVNAKLADPSMTAAMHELFDVHGPVHVSREAVFNGCIKTVRGDAVIFKDPEDGQVYVAELWFHVSVADCFVSCISIWTSLGNNRFRIANDPTMIETEHLTDTCVYWRTADEALVIPK
jgi:hypothetical protein